MSHLQKARRVQQYEREKHNLCPRKFGETKVGLKIVTQNFLREINLIKYAAEHEIFVTGCQDSFDDDCVQTAVNVTACDRL